MTIRHFNQMLLVAIVAGLILFIWLSVLAPSDVVSPASVETNQPAPDLVQAIPALIPTDKQIGEDSLHQLVQQQCERLQDPALSERCQALALQDRQAGKLDPVLPVWDPNACVDVIDPAEQHHCHALLGRDFAISTGDLSRCGIIPVEEIQAECRTAIIINQIKTMHALENSLKAGDPSALAP